MFRHPLFFSVILLGLLCIAGSGYAVVDAEVTGVSFNRTQVKRGQESITATVTIRNTGNQSWTFYIGGSSIRSGGATWYVTTWKKSTA